MSRLTIHILVLMFGLCAVTSAHGATVAQAMASLRTNGAEAEKKCDAEKDEEIQKARTKARNFSAQQNGSNAADPLAACRQMQAAATDASSSLSAFKTKCQSIVKKCKEDLEVLENATLDTRHKRLKEVCEKAISDMASLESELGKMKSQANASAQCQQDIGGGMPQMPQMPQSQATPTPTPEIEKPPENCSNPQFAATNQVCICQVNPRASGCGSDEEPSVEALITDSSQAVDNSYSPTSANTGSPAAAGRAKSDLGQFKGPGAGGGGGGVSASSAAPKGIDQTAKADAMIKIPAGGGGGGGGAAGSFGGAGGGGGYPAGGGGYGAEGGRQPGSANGDGTGPDLTKFLPQQLKADGMTGPHTNLFLKVRTRYKAKSETLKAP